MKKETTLAEQARLLSARRGCSLAAAQAALMSARDNAKRIAEREQATTATTQAFLASRTAIKKVEKAGGTLPSTDVRLLARRIAAQTGCSIGDAQLRAAKQIQQSIDVPATANALMSQRVIARSKK